MGACEDPADRSIRRAEEHGGGNRTVWKKTCQACPPWVHLSNVNQVRIYQSVALIDVGLAMFESRWSSIYSSIETKIVSIDRSMGTPKKSTIGR